MKRLIPVILLLILPIVSALPSIEINKTTEGDVVIQEITNPAIFSFNIKNLGPADNFQIYTLLGVTMTPRNIFYIDHGKETTLEVRAYPNEDLREITGPFLFEYQIKGENSGIFKDQLLIHIIPLKDALEISGENILPNDDEIKIKIKNTRNTHIENLDLEFDSVFFPEFTEKISIGPFEEISFSVPIDAEKIKKLRAGPYVLTAKADVSKKTRLEGIVNFLEREGVAVNRTSSGFIIRKTTITKTNVGNTPTIVDIESRRDIVSRLITGHSIDPVESERKGFFVEYKWQQELQPGESYSVISTTNYTFPFILIVLIILIGATAKAYSKTPLSLNKRVSYVKTKGGEFALKVRLHLKANKNIDSIKLSDTIPATTKLYEGFGKRPDSIDESSRKISWNAGNLNSGEERVFSYIIYSKLKVIGRFELPIASASYTLDNKQENLFSNRTYFVAESASISEED